ncbi:cytochrome P450 [Actinomadura hibisca]|uniref:cytochrome P450 n=1 Tax=Actinomadura hibisca TaxID=68565 RepID=UPI000AE2799D|nr:cytochrome P450 [Actinomadura hibisca]
MSTTGHVSRAKTVPLRSVAPALAARDPLKVVELVQAVSDGGDIVQVNLGGFRPYVVSRPEHVQHVMEDNPGTYVREGYLWEPLEVLVGKPAGPLWQAKREVFQELISGPAIRGFADEMARTIASAVREMAAQADGRPINAAVAMPRIVYRAITRVLLGDSLTSEQADRLGAALQTASASMRPRLLMPFLPRSVPLPSDRTFRQALQVIDGLVFPIVEQAQRRVDAGGRIEGDDIVSRLLRARSPEGDRFNARQLRDGIVSLFVAGTETTGVALTFLCGTLEANPQVAARLYEEIDRVVGRDPVTGAHLREVPYTRKVALEMLRLYPPGWMLPRMVAKDDVIDGVRIEGGGLVVVSPYLTHRLADVWPRPLEFDPERHAPGNKRHRLAYMSFGAGMHACVGKPFFLAEAQLLILTLLSQYRLHLQEPLPARPRLGLTLHPRVDVRFTLTPAPALASDR